MKIAVFLLSLGVALAVVKGMHREKRDATESVGEGDLEMDDKPREDIVEKNLEKGMDAQQRGNYKDVPGFQKRQGYCSLYDLHWRVIKPKYPLLGCAILCNIVKKCRGFHYDNSAPKTKCILQSEYCGHINPMSGGFTYDRWKVTKNYKIHGGTYIEHYKSETRCFQQCKGSCVSADFSYNYWVSPGCFHHTQKTGCNALTWAPKVNHLSRVRC